MQTLALAAALWTTYAAQATQAPPPSPAPPARLAPVGPFIVFFDSNQADLTPVSTAILDNVAAAYLSSGNVQVIITGNTDKAGKADSNLGLSQRRADNVKTYLLGRGIPENVMRTVANGEQTPLVEGPDGAREPQNRNVQIAFGPAAGP